MRRLPYRAEGALRDMYLNAARNHHYVSQAEQRLNAVNPTADRRKQRILVFEVRDRDLPVLNLLDPRGTKIESNLSSFDLFSFEVVDSRYRRNLEDIFGRYEGEVAQKSRGLIEKLRAGSADIKAEVLDVFAIKLLNFFRNPYCVQKAMNTFGAATNYEPTDPDLKTAYRAVLNGSRPQIASICAAFGLTPELYESWLRALFVILAPVAPVNIFEGTIKALFEHNYVSVNVFDYAQPDEGDTCLLSDRGFNMPQQAENLFMFEFNLGARSFACFQMSNLNEYDVRDDVKARMKGHVDVRYVANDRRLLAAYNQRTAYQCDTKVFAAKPSPRLAWP